MKKTCCVLFMLIITAGCMSFTPPSAPAKIPETVQSFEVNYDTAWRNIVQHLTAEGEVIDAQDKETGIIRLQPFVHFNPPKEEAQNMGNCGRLSQKWNFIKYTRQIIIKDNATQGVTVQIKFDYLAYAIDGFLNQRWQPCYTTGKKEKELLNQIAQALK